MKKDEIKKQLWTIPNIITYFRVLCIPFFIWLTLDKTTFSTLGGYQIPLIGLIVLVVAAISDLFDGILARKLNQTTALGAALDPVADKLMHISAILCLTIISYAHWAFLLAFALKELLMILGGLVIVKYSQPIKANYVGKVASVLSSIGIFMSFFHPFFAEKAFYADWIMIGLALIMTYIAFVGYLLQSIPIYKIVFKALKENKDPNDYFNPKSEVDEGQDNEDSNSEKGLENEIECEIIDSNSENDFENEK